MDQIKIGRFIADCRKEKKFTQKELAERIGITDRAISKWENGRGLPDSSIMLDLCKELEISVNELLSGERLEMGNYQENAEQNLVAMKEIDESMENKFKFVGYLMMTGYGVVGVLAAIVFISHLYMNTTNVNYQGEYFGMLLPAFIVMAFMATISSGIFYFLAKYDIVKK